MPEKLTIVAIIPLYNGAKWIEQTIQSVLDQTLQPDEFIVVDDGSIDNGPEIVEKLAEKHPIKLLRKLNGGQSSARNFGVANSKSDLIALLDQDDIWYPTHLEEMIEPFLDHKNKKLGWVHTDFDEVDINGFMITKKWISSFNAEHPKKSLIRCLSENMMIQPSATLISKVAFTKVGYFDENLCGYEDDDLFLRLFRAGYDNIFIDKALSQWRIFEGSCGHSNRMYKSAMIYMKKLLNAYPDDKMRGHYYARDCIAPRFVNVVMAVYSISLRNNNKNQLLEAVNNLKSIIPLLRWKAQIPLRMSLPLLKYTWGGRLLYAVRPYLQKIYRTVFA